ncbi:DUF4158 domain-containing protein [Nonomuraea bangladeshensis]|uniref:DUF4158 domain-containing protein n=1 Tax=Nonomuraea bangladeshensis TaxID=404385 RepID=A0ABV3H0A2_9ACTN
MVDDGDEWAAGEDRPAAKLGWAVQGGTVRMLGTFLAEGPSDVPPEVLEFVAAQLDVDPACAPEYLMRPKTAYEHAWEIRDLLQLVEFFKREHEVRDYLAARAWSTVEGPRARSGGGAPASSERSGRPRALTSQCPSAPGRTPSWISASQTSKIHSLTFCDVEGPGADLWAWNVRSPRRRGRAALRGMQPPISAKPPIDQWAEPPMSGRMALTKASTRASAYCGVSGPERSSQRW